MWWRRTSCHERIEKVFLCPPFSASSERLGRQVTPQSLHTEKQMSAELEVHSQEYVTHLHGSKALGAQPYCPTIQYLPRILANTSAGAKVIRPRLGDSRSRESASSALLFSAPPAS